ncbi:MAG: cyclic nucleotide-binding domain-containing protein, partial [Cyanobacteriota bacterium]|nr:cyclic nucleotide-binding domain-containing protein [Cyanobacteriota bacterium]
LAWAWYSYPGVVLAFFLLMEAAVEGSDLLPDPLGYLRSGAWAFDAGLTQRIWLPLEGAPAVPRLLWIPLVLSAAGALSVRLFQALERGLSRRYQQQGYSQSDDRALLHARLLATFLAINTFFWFVDPLQGLLGPHGAQVQRSLVLCLTAVALFRGWSRDQAMYRRESVSDSLRRQLHDLPGLDAALDGRQLEALSPQEVFTLVKALPAVGRQQARALYQGVMTEMLRSGRLERATSLLELADLRQTLGLDDADHHAVVSLLAEEQPHLLDRDRLQRQGDALRRAAAVEAIDELLRVAGVAVLQPANLPPALQERLDQLRAEVGLDQEQWLAVLGSFGPRGEVERQRLEGLRASWLTEEGLRALLTQLACSDPLLRPLAQVMTRRAQLLGEELAARLQAAGLDPLPSVVPPAGDLKQVMDLLWRDPDPDTAGWVLMLARERDPERAARYLQDPRSGLPDSAFLLSQRRGEIDPDRDEFSSLVASQLFADLSPEGLLWVARQGHLLTLTPGQMAMDKGDAGDWLAVVIAGDVRLQSAAGQQVVLDVGSSVGEMAVITGAPRSQRVAAGPEGACLFVVPRESFEELLRRSRLFGRELLAQLAERLTNTASVLAK